MEKAADGNQDLFGQTVFTLRCLLNFPVEKSNRQREQSARNVNLSHLFIDVFKALKVDDSTKKVSVKIRRGPGALHH